MRRKAAVSKQWPGGADRARLADLASPANLSNTKPRALDGHPLAIVYGAWVLLLLARLPGYLTCNRGVATPPIATQIATTMFPALSVVLLSSPRMPSVLAPRVIPAPPNLAFADPRRVLILLAIASRITLGRNWWAYSPA